MKKIPAVSQKLKKEKEDISNKFSKDVEDRVRGIPYVTRLPGNGWTNIDLMQTVEKYLALGNIFISFFFWLLNEVGKFISVSCVLLQLF